MELLSIRQFLKSGPCIDVELENQTVQENCFEVPNKYTNIWTIWGEATLKRTEIKEQMYRELKLADVKN